MTVPAAPARLPASPASPASPACASPRWGAVLHFIHHPVSARSFIVPLIAGLRRRGVAAELWVEPQAMLHPALQGLDIPMVGASCTIPAAAWRLPWRWWRLVMALRRRRPQAVHAHQTRTALLPLAAAAAAGVPVRIYHNHGLPYLGHGGVVRVVLRLVERINCALATHVLLVSPGNRAAARADGLLEGVRSAVLGAGSICGIDPADYPAAGAQARRGERARLGLDAPGFVLGWVGRPHARKGLPLVLAGWRLSTCGARGGVLMIAGCTEEECRALFGTLPSGVRALGYCADMPGFYRCCDAVILVSAHEGMSYALLEGGASGCALIGSDIPGTRDLVIDGETGLLVAQQAQAVAAAIGRLDQDPGLSRALGQRARQRSIALFDREEVIAALYRFYLQELGDVRER